MCPRWLLLCVSMDHLMTDMRGRPDPEPAANPQPSSREINVVGAAKILLLQQKLIPTQRGREKNKC